MDFKEFIKKDINYSDKVRLTLTSGMTVVCFFGGYKTFDQVEPTLDYVLPTFYAIGKKGQMVTRSAFGDKRSPHLGFSDIRDIEKYVEEEQPEEGGKPSRKFEVTLYYHTNVTVEVEADSEDEAIEASYSEVTDDKYIEAILEGLQEDSSPDVKEITE